MLAKFPRVPMGLPIVVGRKFHHDAIGKSNKGTSFMVPNPDLDGLIQRETRLILRRFTPDDAWWLGCFLRNAGHKAQAPIAVEITVGQTTLFSMLLAGATADNLGWIKRKVAVAWRYQLSSYVMNQKFAADDGMFERFGLDHQTYAAAGGAVPIRVADVGMIGTVAVSGLPQWDDHNMVLDALTALQAWQNDQAGDAHT
jgi:uncharacterized protein (UPF0303 family)